MVAKALQNRGLIPNSALDVTMNVIPSMNVGGMGTPRTTPYSTFTTPRRSYSALPQNTFASGMEQGGRNMYSALPSGGQATTTSPNAFAAGMEQGAKNVYAKPAFVKPQQKPANVPPNQLGQNLLNFATSGSGQAFAQGLLDKSGYSTIPVSFGEALASGMKSMNEYNQITKAQEFEQEKFDYQKTQDTLANEIALLQITTKDQRTALEKKMSVVHPNLVPGSAEYAEKALELAKAGGINIDQTQESEFVKEGIKDGYKAIDKARESINAGKEVDARLEILANLLENEDLDTGPIQEALLPLRKQLDELGLLSLEDSEKLNAQQVFFATANYIVPRMRVVGSGATSDFEANLFKSASPNLANTKEGNKIIVAGMRAINDYNTKRFNLMEKYFAENKNLLGFGDFADQELGSIFPTYGSDEEFDQLVESGKLKAGDLVYDRVNINGFYILTEEDIRG